MKKTLFILIPLFIVGFGIFLFSRENTNNGKSANDLIPISAITHGHGLAVDVDDANKLYIATHHGLLVLMNDKDLYQVGKSKDDYMGFFPHPSDSKVFFSSGHPSFGGNIGFQKSQDGGFTWKKISNGVNGPVDFHAMTVSPVNFDLIYGWYQGNLQRSIDAGNTWEVVNRNLLVVYLAADPKDENAVYAATPQGQGILASKDKGATWNILSKDLEGSQVSTLAINPQNTETMLSFSEKLGLGKSTDSGKTWQKVNTSFDGTILFIAFSKQNPSIVYTLTHTNALYKSSDGGKTWDKIR